MKKIIAIGIIILLFGINLPSITSITVSSPISTEVYCKIFCFGTIENIVFNDDLLDIGGKNLLYIEYRTIEDSKYFRYCHYKNGFGINYSIGNFDFHGILKQHFICGYFVLNNSEKSITKYKDGNQDLVGFGFYFSRELFVGKIKNLIIEDNEYQFDAVDVRRIGVRWYNGSRSFEYDHAVGGHVRYIRIDYDFRGIIRPNFICGIGRYIW